VTGSPWNLLVQTVRKAGAQIVEPASHEEHTTEGTVQAHVSYSSAFHGTQPAHMAYVPLWAGWWSKRYGA
jgi:hypothetical protein